MQWRKRVITILRKKPSWWVRLAVVYAGIALPIICHVMTLDDPPDAARYQSGALHDKLSFTLSVEVGFPLFPFLLFPMVCLALLIYDEQRFAKCFWVRLGILTGVPVTAWYSTMLGVVLTDVEELLSITVLRLPVIFGTAIVIPLVIYAVLRIFLWLRKLLRISWGLPLTCAAIAIYPVGVGFVLVVSDDLTRALTWPMGALAVFSFMSLIFAPFWCFGVYLGMLMRLAIVYPGSMQFSLLQMMIVFTWLAAFLATCRWVVLRSLAEYATLPTTPPENCYIATAAARGHPCFVRSQQIRTCIGTDWPVNRQLAILKAGELSMRSLCPTFHCLARRVYDCIGPRAAALVRSPWRADLAYVGLKPFEFAAWLWLCVILGRNIRVVDRLYTPEGE